MRSGKGISLYTNVDGLFIVEEPVTDWCSQGLTYELFTDETLLNSLYSESISIDSESKQLAVDLSYVIGDTLTFFVRVRTRGNVALAKQVNMLVCGYDSIARSIELIERPIILGAEQSLIGFDDYSQDFSISSCSSICPESDLLYKLTQSSEDVS